MAQIRKQIANDVAPNFLIDKPVEAQQMIAAVLPRDIADPESFLDLSLYSPFKETMPGFVKFLRSKHRDVLKYWVDASGRPALRTVGVHVSQFEDLWQDYVTELRQKAFAGLRRMQFKLEDPAAADKRIQKWYNSNLAKVWFLREPGDLDVFNYAPYSALADDFAAYLRKSSDPVTKFLATEAVDNALQDAKASGRGARARALRHVLSFNVDQLMPEWRAFLGQSVKPKAHRQPAAKPKARKQPAAKPKARRQPAAKPKARKTAAAKGRKDCAPLLAELRKEASRQNIAGRSKMNKAQLCRALNYA